MFIASSILNLMARLRGPKAQHRLDINRTLRWGAGEAEWQILDHLVDPELASIDVGANAGIYTERLAQLCRKVHAFEPIPWLAADLVRKCSANVVVHRVALSNRAGQARLRIPTRAGIEENGLTTMEELNALNSNDSVRVVECATNRLDNIISEPVGFIKIDVEGHELSVLEGAIQTIRTNKPVLVVESERAHNPGAPENVFQFLEAEGYVGLYLFNGIPRAVGNVRPEGGIVNYIFIRKDSSQRPA